MWYYFDKSKFYETEFKKVSDILKNYFLSIKGILYSAPNTTKTKYERNLKIVREYFINSQKCYLKLQDFDNYLRILPLKEIEKLNSIIKNNLNIEIYLKNYQNFIKYEDLKLYGFSNEFKELLKELDIFLWEYIRTKNKGQLAKEYYDMLYKSLNGRTCCPFCGINEIKNSEYSVKLSPLEHFIPKRKYPFVAWNVDNIFLSCEDCNSKKSEKNLRQINSTFFPIKLNSENKVELELISYDLGDNNNNNCKIKFIPSMKDFFDNYLLTWNDFFNIESRIKKELFSYIKKTEKRILRKKSKNKNFDFFTDHEDSLETGLEEGNIIKIAYHKYKLKELEEKEV